MKALRVVLLFIFLAIFSFSATYLALIFYTDRKEIQKNTVISEEYSSESEGTTEVHVFIPYINEQIKETETEEVIDLSLLSVDFPKLKAQYPNIIGWIKINETKINYALVQAEDNNYYVKTAVDGSHSRSGSIFLDFRNSPDFSDVNTVIYGHNRNNTTMFGTLPKYKKEAYYSENKDIEIYTENGLLLYRIYAVEISDTDDETYNLTITDNASFDSHVERVRKAALYETGIVPVYGDRLLTLSTCTNEYKTERLLIHAVLISRVGYFDYLD